MRVGIRPRASAVGAWFCVSMRLVSPLAYMRDPRLAAVAISAAPAWLWSTDGTRVLWANAAGLTAFGATTLAELTEWQFAPNEPAAVEVIRLAATLDPGGAARHERLNGFGDGLAGMSMCACSRISLADATPAILITATLQLRRLIALTERISRLFDGCEDAIAAFAADGTLLYANTAGTIRLNGARSVGALGAGALAERALGSGSSTGETFAGEAEVLRLGTTPDVVLLARFGSLATPERADEVEAAPSGIVSAAVSAAVSPDGAVRSPAPDSPAPREPLPQRRHPLRFVWQMDADGRFSIDSEEFIELVGVETAQLLGRGFDEINDALHLDPLRLVARAVATRDTWSGITLAWPVGGDAEPLKVELSGLPVYDRDRQYGGYRGFGVCRNVEQLAALARLRRAPSNLAGDAASAPRRATEPAPFSWPRDAYITVAPAARNVVPFRTPAPVADAKVPELSPGERTAFGEIARRLSARLKGDEQLTAAAPGGAATPAVAVLRTAPGAGIDGRRTDTAGGGIEADTGAPPAWLAPDADARQLLDRLPVGVLIYQLDTLVYANQAFLGCVGCADLAALAERGGLDSLFVELAPELPDDRGGRVLTIRTGATDAIRVAGRMFAVPWGDTTADVVMLGGPADRHAQNTAGAAPAERAPGRAAARRVAADAADKDGAVRRAEATAAERANLLAMISHEVRTPLTTIVGFAETMLDERFGPIGNERYRKYLNDIRAAGANILGLFDNVVSLSSVAIGKDKAAASADINATAQECVARMQPDASRARVLIRSALGGPLPPAAAAPDAARQIVHILLANSIKFAGAGGQVIVATSSSPGKIILRLRDTGTGLSARELAAALQAPDATAQAAQPASGGLSFAVARALAEANGAAIAISSKPGEGTLVEVAFTALPGRAD